MTLAPTSSRYYAKMSAIADALERAKPYDGEHAAEIFIQELMQAGYRVITKKASEQRTEQSCVGAAGLRAGECARRAAAFREGSD